MYGQSRIVTDQTLTAPTTFATDQDQVATGGSLRFSVEEEEMFVTLEFDGVMSHSVAEEPFDATFFVDGADIAAPLVDGLWRHTSPVTATDPMHVNVRKTLRLAQGEHRVEIRFKTAAGNLVVAGLLHPATLSALRLSQNAVVAANMTSKQVTGAF